MGVYLATYGPTVNNGSSRTIDATTMYEVQQRNRKVVCCIALRTCSRHDNSALSFRRKG